MTTERKRRKRDHQKTDDDVIKEDLCAQLVPNDRITNGDVAHKYTPDYTTLGVSHEVYSSITTAANILKDSIIELQEALDVAKKLAIDTAPVASSIDQVKNLIAYAHRLSFTTNAPPGFVPGKTPLMLFKPPAPQDMHMRSSALFQFHREYAAKKTSAVYSTIKKTTIPEETTIKQEEKKQLPTNLAEILSSLPPIPKGWKPGDAIAIPGFPPHMKTASLLDEGEGEGILAGVRSTSIEQQSGGGIIRKSDTKIEVPEKKKVRVEKKVEEKEKKEEKQRQPPPVQRPISAAFDFALNPDLEIEFNASDSDHESSSSDDSD